MLTHSFKDIKRELVFLDSIKEDYLYNFSLTLNKPLIGPHMLQLLITTRCNARCKMCEVWRVQEDEVETFYVKKLIDDTYKMGNLREVHFTGGEALLRFDIFNLIKYVKDYYPAVRTSLITNGLLLNRENIDRLFDVGLKNLCISIDSPNSKIHNSLRGEMVLERLIEALDYINKEKKKRGVEEPILSTNTVLMEQTLDTLYDMLDFCVKYNFSGFHVQPYVCNSDLRGKRDDKFWILKERLPVLKDVLDKIESKKGKLPLYIELFNDKIYSYFSEPTYIDKCYAGFTRALVVGKKICFVCNGPNNEKIQHLGDVDKDSINIAWFSEKANFFRETIKTCRKSCTQLCSTRPSSDSLIDIHQRLIEQKNLFLVFRELHFLEEYIIKYPTLPIKELIDWDYRFMALSLKSFLNSIDNLKLYNYSEEAKKYLLLDLKLFNDYFKKRNDSISLIADQSKSIEDLGLIEKINFYKNILESI